MQVRYGAPALGTVRYTCNVRLRALALFQLVAIVAALTTACASRNEDTSCPAMERAIDEASRNGLLEPLPLSAEDGEYRIALEGREVERDCNVSYRFRVSGMSAADFEAGQFDRFICGPEPSGTKGFSMDDGEVLMDAQISQWQPTGEMTVRVGPSCRGVTLSFTHVGRIAQP